MFSQTFHCHNRVHEDFAMVTLLLKRHHFSPDSNGDADCTRNFSYDNVTSQFEDPMDPRFHAEPYTGTDLTQVREELLPALVALNMSTSFRAQLLVTMLLIVQAQFSHTTSFRYELKSQSVVVFDQKEIVVLTFS